MFALGIVDVHVIRHADVDLAWNNVLCVPTARQCGSSLSAISESLPPSAKKTATLRSPPTSTRS